MSHLILVRHGQSEWNLENRFTGCQIINKKVFASIKNKSFSILQIWNDLIKENKLYGYESKNKFYHVTDLEIYNKLLKSY